MAIAPTSHIIFMISSTDDSSISSPNSSIFSCNRKILAALLFTSMFFNCSSSIKGHNSRIFEVENFQKKDPARKAKSDKTCHRRALLGTS
jgi:hypothetical protein